MDGLPSHMRPWDEVQGPVHEVEEQDGHCLALIGKIPVILPHEMAARIRAVTGQKIGLLRTEQDYRLRVCDQRRC
jgi:hypothetical protein